MNDTILVKSEKVGKLVFFQKHDMKEKLIKAVFFELATDFKGFK